MSMWTEEAAKLIKSPMEAMKRVGPVIAIMIPIKLPKEAVIRIFFSVKYLLMNAPRIGPKMAPV